MSPDYYRRVWNTDMLNKLLDKRIPWNPGLSQAELIDGFEEMMVPGVYERPFFGGLLHQIWGGFSEQSQQSQQSLLSEQSHTNPKALADPTKTVLK